MCVNIIYMYVCVCVCVCGDMVYDRYIGFLEADLVDYPGDARTLYYLGYAHYDNFKKAFDVHGRSDVIVSALCVVRSPHPREISPPITHGRANSTNPHASIHSREHDTCGDTW